MKTKLPTSRYNVTFNKGNSKKELAFSVATKAKALKEINRLKSTGYTNITLNKI